MHRKRRRDAVQIIPLFDTNDPPFIPIQQPPERRAQATSRMPLAAPAKPARSVLDEASAVLSSIKRDIGRSSQIQGLPPQLALEYWWGAPPPGNTVQRQKLAIASVQSNVGHLFHATTLIECQNLFFVRKKAVG